MCFVSRNNPMVIGETSNALKMLPKLFSNSSLNIIWSEGRAVENLDVEKASHNPIPHLMLFEYSEVIFLKPHYGLGPSEKSNHGKQFNSFSMLQCITLHSLAPERKPFFSF